MAKNEKMELARRLFACKWFDFTPGMGVVSRFSPGDSRYQGRARVTEVDDTLIDGQRLVIVRGASVMSALAGDWLPDLDDPATLGCLLALAQEAWQGCVPGAWITVALPGEQPCVGIEKLAEALVEALEAAPAREG